MGKIGKLSYFDIHNGKLNECSIMSFRPIEYPRHPNMLGRYLTLMNCILHAKTNTYMQIFCYATTKG